MRRLGYERFAAAGGDWGTSISTSLALQYPRRLIGIHLVPPLAPADPDSSEELTDAERAAMAELGERTRDGSGYSVVQATRPQTIGFALNDSPAMPGRVSARSPAATPTPSATRWRHPENGVARDRAGMVVRDHRQPRPDRPVGFVQHHPIQFGVIGVPQIVRMLGFRAQHELVGVPVHRPVVVRRTHNAIHAADYVT